MTILILGAYDDEHVRHVAAALDDCEIFDTRDFPLTASIAFDPTGGGQLELPTCRWLSFDEIEAVYWRNYFGPASSDDFLTDHNSRSLLETFVNAVPTLWVNGWQAFQLHQRKPHSLQLAAEAGADVPETLVTTDARLARHFIERHANVIHKPVQGGGPTQRILAHQIRPEGLDNLPLAPTTLQEYIPGTNIRVFVAGENVLACEVATRELDFRYDPDPKLVVHHLPPEIALLSRRIAAALHLVWTGMDYRLTPEGRYIFLEANPSPMFLGFEQETDLPLTEALVDVLTHSAARVT